MKHVFIINPISGKANAYDMYNSKINDIATDLNLDYEVHCTNYIGHAKEISSNYAKTGESVRLYACGGDGTLNEVFQGAYMHKNAEVASIPCGSGNDFVRNFGECSDFTDLINNINGEAIPIDLISVNGKISIAICSVGIDSEVAYGIPKYRRLPFCGGKNAYNLSILERLCKPLGCKLHVEIDGEVLEDDLLLAAVCNGKSYGSGAIASPYSNVQDGVLECVMAKKIGRARIAGVLSLYKSGNHITENQEVLDKVKDVIIYKKASKVLIRPVENKNVIVNIDGECGPDKGLDAQIMPKSGTFVIPKHLFIKNFNFGT